MPPGAPLSTDASAIQC